MTKPCDDFGAYLQKLRAKRRVTAQAVSRAVGKSDTYIGGWERYDRTVNMDILESVIEELGLSPAERQQLQTLAFKRNYPDLQYEFTDDVKLATANVSSALHYVEHESVEVGSFEPAGDATVAGCYLLALYAISGFTDYGVDVIEWPEWVYKNKIVRQSASARPLPKGLLAKVRMAPSLEKRFARTRLATSIAGCALADVYRLWLFSDLDRSLKLAAALSRFSIDWDPLLQTMLTFDFADARADRLLNAQRVRGSVIVHTCKRLLTDRVWTSCSAISASDSRSVFPHALEAIDVMAVHAAFLAKDYLDRAQWEQPVSNYVQQIVRDAAFSLRLMPKGRHLLTVAMYAMYLQLIGTPLRDADGPMPNDDVDATAEAGLADMLKLVVSAQTLMETEAQDEPHADTEHTTRTTSRPKKRTTKWTKGKAKKKRKA